MESADLRQRKAALVEQYGPWTAHTIRLSDDVSTYDENPDFDQRVVDQGIHLRRIVQCVADLAGKPLRECRVLDLACLEGLYGIELARHGAEVVAIEGREINAAKARFAAEALRLGNYKIAVDDVRNLSAETYGQFDVVLCLGILYHLDAPDVFRFIEQMSSVCTRLLVIDTMLAATPRRSLEWRGRKVHGRKVIEHLPWVDAARRAKKLWASLDNRHSFWLTRASLYRLLTDAGFTSSYTVNTPALDGWWLGRETIAGVKGDAVRLESVPPVNELPPARAPERTAALFLREVWSTKKAQLAFPIRLWRSLRGKRS